MRNTTAGIVRKYPKTITATLTWEDINRGKCRNPNYCPFKLSVKREIGGHGYVYFDASGVSITRRPDYREKAFLPKVLIKKMVMFDRKPNSLRPCIFRLTFFKTTKIKRLSPEQREEYTRRAKRNGTARRQYGIRQRIIGLGVSE